MHSAATEGRRENQALSCERNSASTSHIDARAQAAARQILAVLNGPCFSADLADVLRDLRWQWRRWSVRLLFYRWRLPLRRRRWRHDRIEITRAFTKAARVNRTRGPAIAFGEFSGTHGLGRAASYDAEFLRSQHSALTLVDIGDFLRGRPIEKITFDQPFENVYFLSQPDTYGVICDLVEPHSIAAAWRCGRWVWETPVFPEDWRFAEDLVHEVWAPSKFCADTFRRAVDVPVHVRPYAVQRPQDTGIDMRARLGLAADQCVGLAIMDIQSCPERKNPWAHVRAWKRAFGGDPRFQLLIKLRVGKRTRIVIDELGELVDSDDNIRLLTDELTNDEISALQRSADIFLSLHRSEGFGLNIYEALLLGKPVIATHWSANAEYGPSFANYEPVPIRLTRYRDWTGHYADHDFQWAATCLG